MFGSGHYIRREEDWIGRRNERKRVATKRMGLTV